LDLSAAGRVIGNVKSVNAGDIQTEIGEEKLKGRS
jgi:hypothetical protein